MQHPALASFALLAVRFCSLVEDRESHSAESFLSGIHPLLAQLYAAGLGLPSTDVQFGEELYDAGNEVSDFPPEPDPDGMPHEEWHPLFDALTAKLGERCFYREVHDPYDPPEQSEVTGSLADDLVDIYRDLRTGLRKWQRGESGDALWEWRFNFEAHWGQHVVDALRAIHSLAAWHDLAWPPVPAAESRAAVDVGRSAQVHSSESSNARRH